MYKGLSPGAINVNAPNLEAAFKAAIVGGFQGVEVNISEIADLLEVHGANALRAKFEGEGVLACGFGLTVDFRGDEQKWQDGLTALPRQARAAKSIDCYRCSTWLTPCSNDKTYDENWDFHITRLKPIAHILNGEGIQFGLEFVGPETSWTSMKYPFVHELKPILALGQAIGDNAGVLLDCWHWYTSGGTVADILELSAEQVVYVHINDAPAGVPLNKQMDHIRALPGETGVIDIGGFLGALKKIGYDGPIVAEPFKKELKELDSDEARLKTISDCLDRIFSIAGI